MGGYYCDCVGWYVDDCVVVLVVGFEYVDGYGWVFG